MNKENLKELFLNIKNTTIEDVKHIDYDLKELMILEKKKLGFNENQLVFISAGDLSKFYWCQMQTYFSILEHEVDKYSGYLQDKIEYSIKLNKLNKIPQTKEELIKIGEDINLDDISKLLKLKDYKNTISNEEINEAKAKLEKCNISKERGHYLETIHARKLPQIHWVKKYNDFIFTCEPDGIGEDFVYEFKSSKNKYFSKYSIQKAKLQTDIYAICFNKKHKIIDQLTAPANKIETIKEELNTIRVDNILNEIKKIIKGKLPQPPKEEFKCKNCEYKNKCQIKK